ncbi:uncharacterized protein LOC131034097 isoform X2 [Cryptomeria japonica]|uniref:uncharacterized protein LOC131034097 isoform X2 n=1 Tax=Cryptomeria japonica TaxID=3369 RepID=UPI0027DA575B|nr:uncharacterized protein LOC131034097 isoform X2 [Cryptomeria japonica]
MMNEHSNVCYPNSDSRGSAESKIFAALKGSNLNLVVKQMDEDKVVVVGLISDTHGVVEEAALQALKRATDTIIHAGDVGDKNYKSRLSAEQIIAHLQRGTNKSIVAVSGNVDEGHADLPHSVSLAIHGKNILVEHICGFPPKKELEERVIASCIDIVVFGHSHVPGVWWHNNAFWQCWPKTIQASTLYCISDDPFNR